MARQIIQTSTCDWHAQLSRPELVEATETRENPQGTENDLCRACAMIFDWMLPRIEQLVDFFRQDTLERLFRVGHTPTMQKRDRKAIQPALPEASPPTFHPQPQTLEFVEEAVPTSTPTANPRQAGQWLDDHLQVICPLPHRTGAPVPYYVKVRDRGSHAKSSHHLLGPQIAYEIPDPQKTGQHLTLDVKCYEHTVCAESGGYGFENLDGLRLHLTKTQTWEKTPKAKDATETLTGAA
jgi:hypothetical protein